MKAKPVIIGLVVVVLIVAGVLIFQKKPATAPSNNTTNTQSSSKTGNAADTITFDGSSFTPASLTVTAGTMVTVKNTSSQSMAFDSDPHPVHTDDTDLNAGDIAPGQSKSFTVTKKGSFGYHDHLDPSIGGKITIQ